MKTKSLPLSTSAVSSGRPKRSFSKLFFFVLALVPFLRTCYVVASTGADCISNDDILFLSLTENMLSGAYDWRNYFQDTFINGHCAAAAQAFFMLAGPSVGWNQYLLCSSGIVLAVLRMHFTTKFLCASTEQKHYWPVLALVSWMLFSFSQISLFTTGIFSVVWQSCLLFGTLAAYLLWRYPDRLSVAVAASVLGVLSCWNLAVGLPGWLVYLGIVFLRGTCKQARALTIVTGLAIASMPYFAFVVSGATHSRKFCEQYVLWVNPPFILNALGRSFANDIGNRFGVIPSSMLAGTLGILAFALFAWVMVRVPRFRQLLFPPFILCSWSLALISMIGIVRFAVAPWYALIAALFWSGLTAAAAFVISDCLRSDKSSTMRRSLKFPALTVSSLILLLVSIWSWQYNKSYLDKQYFLENRTPVSASVLRNYDIAPEAFASYVFKLHGLSTFVTGKMLERNQWSVFSQHQTWEMQGDSIFPLAEGYSKGVSLNRAHWIKSRDQRSIVGFRTPTHLNLCLLPGGSAVWRVSLPKNKRSVNLKTTLVSAKGFLSVSDQNLVVDFSARRGTRFDIMFRNSSFRNVVIFEYPILELRD